MLDMLTPDYIQYCVKKVASMNKRKHPGPEGPDCKFLIKQRSLIMPTSLNSLSKDFVANTLEPEWLNVFDNVRGSQSKKIQKAVSRWRRKILLVHFPCVYCVLLTKPCPQHVQYGTMGEKDRSTLQNVKPQSEKDGKHSFIQIAKEIYFETDTNSVFSRINKTENCFFLLDLILYYLETDYSYLGVFAPFILSPDDLIKLPS